MQEQPSEIQKAPEKEHRFLPRLVGLIAGVTSGIFTGKILRDMSYNDFINKGLTHAVRNTRVDTYVVNAPEGADLKNILQQIEQGKVKHTRVSTHVVDVPTDTYIADLWKKIKAVLTISKDLESRKFKTKEDLNEFLAEKPKESTFQYKTWKELPPQQKMEQLSFWRRAKLTPGQKELLKDIDPTKIPLEEWKKANEQFKAAKKALRTRWREAKHAAEQVPIDDLRKRTREKIYNPRNNYWDEVLEKLRQSFNPEIKKELQFILRHSQHKKWIFAGGTVALCTVGYAAYKATDFLMNGREKKNHQQAVTDRRESGESAGTAVT